LSRELSRAERYHFNLAFALIEIEEWQSLVARRGRTVMLDQLADATARIRENIRANDEFAYFGAGRCGLVLPYTDLAGAHAVLRRVQEILRTHTGFRTRVGIAEFPDDAKSEESLVTEAEAALEVGIVRRPGLGLVETQDSKTREIRGGTA
jgi:PleD family two-component response regulator